MSCCDVPGLLPLVQALEMLKQSSVCQLKTETLALTNALDCILADNIVSPHHIPNYNNSAMDGYACHYESWDSSRPLKQVGRALAGAAYEGEINPGECIRIMTGAKVPDSCNCVIMQENTHVDGDNITVTQSVHSGDNIRLAGNDVKKDSLIISAGKCLGPIDIGMLATLGFASVEVYRKLRVAIFSTGDEITPLGEPLKEGFVYDSNRYLINAALQRLKVDIIDYGVLPDDPEVIERTFIDAANSCDAIISTGGVSVGEADFTRDILLKLGEITFYKLAMKPGKPFAFGSINNACFFGLPGNPVSAAVTFHQLALPALRAMAGEQICTQQELIIKTDSRLKKRPGRVDFQRGLLCTNDTGEIQVTTAGTQSSGALSSMLEADCYIKLEPERGNVEAGETVTVIPFDRYFA
ncbi:molybdopterin molybdotransferase MoeA [Teredinibacter haidensis]|uniref:molybdopterin molybdotransferase MoeA n=1 Tax=Teredinibacter haidensis TaxID=2731755 RepID=UPI0009489C34|nr:gephyrin-like molybdotransferase Glp [Teredinibacter haidensis]